MRLRALCIHAGPRAMRHLLQHGLRAADIAAIPAAAGGPKGLVLGPLDRFLFGQWLAQSNQPIDLVGASIGAWRMASACLDNPVAALARFEETYIHQEFPQLPGEKRPPAARVSAQFRHTLTQFFSDQAAQAYAHPRYSLHLIAARGRHVLNAEHPWLTALGYVGAFACNAVDRRALGWWLQRAVFSSPNAVGQPSALPFDALDLPTCHVALSEANFLDTLQASCAIPFALAPVRAISGAPAGQYWDGGVTDYHLHLNFSNRRRTENPTTARQANAGFDEGTSGKLVLYPHFQHHVVPGWLDKHLRWRHRATAYLDDMVVLSPHPAWVARLPSGKLPDRHDFIQYRQDVASRVRVWRQAVSASAQLADEFQAWLSRPDMAQVQPL